MAIWIRFGRSGDPALPDHDQAGEEEHHNHRRGEHQYVAL